jgi:ketosteroid isomerase-like protein
MDISTAVPHTELEALSRRYAAAVDQRDGAALLSLFTPDATLRVERRGRGPQILTGHDELAGIIGVVARFPCTFHLVAQCLYVVDGDSAIGEVYCIANHFSEDEAGSGHNHIWYIRYQDRYSADSDGRWRIAQRTLAVDATEDRPAAVEGGAA